MCLYMGYVKAKWLVVVLKHAAGATRGAGTAKSPRACHIEESNGQGKGLTPLLPPCYIGFS